MSLEFSKGLRSVLTGTVSVKPRFRQGGALPAARYQVISVTRQNSVDGLRVGVTETGVQIDCLAETYDAARTLADSVRGVLDRYKGSWGTLTARFVHLQTENEFYEQDGDHITHWVSQRYQVWTDMD